MPMSNAQPSMSAKPELKGSIWIVDDEQEMRSLLEDFLRAEGYEVRTFSSALEALHTLTKAETEAGNAVADSLDLVLSDIRMAELDGMQFLKAIRAQHPEIPVILATAFGSIEIAIEAMRNGAYHYLVKPFKLSEVAVTIERALERRHLSRENRVLKQELKKSWAVGNLIGKSPGMRAVYDLIHRVSGSTSNILISGESGTGKEMVARAIHESGPRTGKPFVAINCTAIPENLLESELFGHAKGSFTGAIARKKGLIEEADGGTLFLDEIGDMSPGLQVKLLRVLQEKKIRPVGDNALYDVDVRVIAASHKDLKEAIREGKFREDLFYRLSVIPVIVPPLRERPDDIPLLAEHFLAKYRAAMDTASARKLRGFSRSALAKLMRLRWEGNVRELENVVERAVVLAPGPLIEAEDIPDLESQNPEVLFKAMTGDMPTIEELERRYIRVILDKTGGRKDKAAHILGINRRTLYRKEHEYGWATGEETEQHPQTSPPPGEVQQ